MVLMLIGCHKGPSERSAISETCEINSAEINGRCVAPPGPEWLSEAVFYQIYPQTYYDSNADGIGDLPGIVEKLDYVRSLGVDGFWINPFFESPFYDAGYDISDYYKVASRYGTNQTPGGCSRSRTPRLESIIRLRRQLHQHRASLVHRIRPAGTK
jgi:1,4-alpha-glucan branching enzyme